jgi:hypothetical protein
MCAAIVKGVSVIYGLNGASVSNAVVQSYTNDGEFANEATVVDETGNTITWRGDDRRTQITVEILAKTTSVPVLGSSFTMVINTASAYPTGVATAAFSGWVTKVSDKGSNKDFSAVSVTAVGYEAIA